MPWANGDKERIAKYLGHDYQLGYLNNIQVRMDFLTNLSSYCVDHCTAYLTRLDAIAALIDSNTTEGKAGTSSRMDGANPVEYLPGEPIATFRDEGLRYATLLAHALGLPLMRNFFVDVDIESSSITKRRG